MAKKKMKAKLNESKIYRFYGINTAVELLRPGASWEWTSGIGFTRWEDSRPQPTEKEVRETMETIKNFEDSIHTIWTEKQLEEIKEQLRQREG